MVDERLPQRLRWRLPALYEHLAGRRAERVELAELLAESSLLVLRGLPGIGKTQLAAHVVSVNDDTDVIAWLRGSEPGLAEDARSLGVELGAVTASTPAGDHPILALCDLLASRVGWTLVIDAARGPDALAPLLSLAGPGKRIVVTTTDGGWHEPGAVRDVRSLDIPEAAAFLLERTRESGPKSETAAGELAVKLRGVPLALRQCEGWVRSGRSVLCRYQELFDARAQEVLRSGPGPLDHRRTVAVTFDLAVAAAESSRRGARGLLSALSFVADDPFARLWVVAGDADAVAVEDQLRALAGVSLVELSSNGVTVHGLVAEVMRGTMLPDAARLSLERARAWILDNLPNEALEPSAWPIYGDVVGHLEALADHLLAHGVDGAETVMLLDRLATFHEAQGRLGRARHRFDQAVAAASLLDEDDDARSSAEGDRALLVAKIDLAEGIPMLEAIVERRRARAEERPKSLADALNNLGWAVSSREPVRSAELQREAVGIYARLFPEAEWPDRQEIVHGLMNQALAHWRGGQPDDAKREWLRVLELARGATVDRRAEIAGVLSNLGVVYDNGGDGARAVEYSQEGYDTTVELLGERHPDAVLRLVNLGGARRVLGEQRGRAHIDAALEEHRRAEELAKELDPPSPRLVALAANNQGVDLIALGRPDAAIAPLEAALELRRDLAGSEPDLDVAQSLGNLAKALLGAGRFDDAEARFHEVLGLCDALSLPQEHERRALSWDGVGDIAARRGQHGRAVESYDRACRAFVASYGADAPRARRAREKRDDARRAAGAGEP